MPDGSSSSVADPWKFDFDPVAVSFLEGGGSQPVPAASLAGDTVVGRCLAPVRRRKVFWTTSNWRDGARGPSLPTVPQHRADFSSQLKKKYLEERDRRVRSDYDAQYVTIGEGSGAK